jgi:isoleucyl-tRNA synthetase
VPIIVFYCERCQEPFTERKVLDRVVQLFAEHSADAWYEKTAAELMGPGVTCHRCGGAEFRKESDILDVWFDSGSSHLAVLTPENGLPWPSNMYLEGGDQYRGWFHSSLLVGVGLKGEAPYRETATNGWTLDEQGRAMSKSQGIGIHPDEIIPKFGADVLRLWTASVDFTEDVRLSPTILERLTDAYRKFRNTFRWALGNLDDFDPARDALPPAQMSEIDLWILLRAEDVVAKCRAWYDEYAFHKVYRGLYDFATIDLSATYFDISKDRLYTGTPKSQMRRSVQTAIHRIAYALVRLMAPMLAYTTEEVWGYLKRPEGSPASVHMDLFPEPGELTAGFTAGQRSRLENWDKLFPVREEVQRRLAVARDEEKLIGSSLEASVQLTANGELYPLLYEYSKELPGLFIVSEVALENGAASGALSVKVQRATGDKCERCWKYLREVGADSEFPTLCASCSQAVREILGEK